MSAIKVWCPDCAEERDMGAAFCGGCGSSNNPVCDENPDQMTPKELTRGYCGVCGMSPVEHLTPGRWNALRLVRSRREIAHTASRTIPKEKEFCAGAVVALESVVAELKANRGRIENEDEPVFDVIVGLLEDAITKGAQRYGVPA